MDAVNRYVDELRRRWGRQVPYVESVRGDAARIVLVFRQPNPLGAMVTGKLSLQNPDRAAAALRARLAETSVPISEILFWNMLPWAPDGELKSPSRDELVRGAGALEGLLEHLTSDHLAVILVGSVATQGGEFVTWRRGVCVFESPSTSPPAGNMPDNKRRFREALERAHAWVNGAEARSLTDDGQGRPASPRNDVVGKLASCSDWVQRTFLELERLCAPYLDGSSDESGPGRRYRDRQRRWFCRLHPKQEYIAVGFPNAMRDAVRETGLLREQQEAAWINYGPEHSRDMIPALLKRAAGASDPSISDKTA